MDLNDISAGTKNFYELFGRKFDDVQELPLGSPIKVKGKNGTVTVKRYSLRRSDGQKPNASKKVVILPEHSPLRKLNIDKFELVKEKKPVSILVEDIAPELKKTLKLLNKNGEIMFKGADSIHKFMKSVAHIIRKA